MKISVGNVLSVLVTVFIIGVVCSCQTSGKKNKNYDLSNPSGAIETISNDVAEESEEWDREQWDVIADNLENAIKSLPAQLRDDEASLVTATLSRMKVYGERHKRTASGLLEVINGYQQKNNASPALATAQTAAVPAAAPTPPAKMETGIIKQEGGYTNVRKTPSLNGDIAIKLKDGSPILYNRYDASWCVVYNTSGQKLGYVHSSKIVADSPRAAAPWPAGAAVRSGLLAVGGMPPVRCRRVFRPALGIAACALSRRARTGRGSTSQGRSQVCSRRRTHPRPLPKGWGIGQYCRRKYQRKYYMSPPHLGR